MEKKYKLYATGTAKLTEEFDCVEILNSIRNLNAMMWVILDHHQRSLLKYSSFHQIEISFKNEIHHDYHVPDHVKISKLPHEIFWDQMKKSIHKVNAN